MLSLTNIAANLLFYCQAFVYTIKKLLISRKFFVYNGICLTFRNSLKQTGFTVIPIV